MRSPVVIVLLSGLVACGSKESPKADPPVVDKSSGTPAAPAVPAPPAPAKKSAQECDGARQVAAMTVDLRSELAKQLEFHVENMQREVGWEVPKAKGKPNEAAIAAANETATKLATDATTMLTTFEACATALKAKAPETTTKCTAADTALAEVRAAADKLLAALDAAKLDPAYLASEQKSRASFDRNISGSDTIAASLGALTGCP